MDVQIDLSREDLFAELVQLRQEVADLRAERDDLEVLLEMTTDHSDVVEEELYSKAEEALRESERQLRLIVEAIPVPVVISRISDDEIVYANTMVSPQFNLPNDTLVGCKIADFYFDPADRAPLEEKLSQSGGIDNYELRVKKLDGSPLWVEVSMRYITFNGELSMLSAIHDITERKQAAQALEAAIDNLQQIDKLKDEFLANTSHELRTPLNGIIGIAESMIDGAAGPLTSEQEHNLSMVISSGRRLSNLVNDILDFSKLRHHDIELQIKPLDLRAIIDLVFALSKPLASAKPLKMENLVSSELPPIDGDENRLQQILLNLVSNAIKFTPEGTVCVSALSTHDMVEVSVADTGIGIPEHKLVDIFQSFEQLDSSTERAFSGTGLGLPITKQLVELHGGTIHVKSTPNQGSQFIFTLPISRGHPDANPMPEVSRIREEPVSNRKNGERKEFHDYMALQEMVPLNATEPSISASQSVSDRDFTILVVDDEPINRQVLLNHLSLQNYTVAQASDGIEALRAVEQYNPDLILLDVMMPRMSGYEACKELRRQHSPSELPVVMLTAKNQIDNLVEGFNVGANDYLTKPFAKDELLTRLQTHLRLTKMNQASGRFVPGEFLEFLQKDSIVDVQLGDYVSKEMTVMFSDIRSFTLISETMTPQENFDFVNAYLQRVSPAIREYDGFIVKYLGDGMMAIFPNHPDDAIQAGITKLQRINAYNRQRRQRGREPIQVGIGVHTGHMMVGMVGESGRMQGDAFSDHVNLTARLEGLTKFYNVSFIITAETYQQLSDPDKYKIRFMDKVRVQGRQEPIPLYEVYQGDSPDQLALKDKTQADFEEALQLYYTQRFVEAQTMLFGVLQQNPQDKVAWHHLVQATQLAESGVPEHWTGVTVMNQK